LTYGCLGNYIKIKNDFNYQKIIFECAGAQSQAAWSIDQAFYITSWKHAIIDVWQYFF